MQKRYTMLFARREYRCWTPWKYIAIDRDAEVGMRSREVRFRLHNVVRRHGAHVSQRSASGKAPTRYDGLTTLLGLGERKGGAEPNYRTALTDHALEQVAQQWRRHKHAHIEGARGFAEDRHILRIAAELRDIFTNPFEGGNLVVDAL